VENRVALWRRLTSRRAGPPTLTPEERSIVVRGIRKLSAGFGGGRNIAGQRYLDDPALLGAYLLFFGPISERQATSALTRSGISVLEGRALDVGTGAGSVARALVARGIVEIVGLDHSDAAVHLAREWVGPALTPRTWTAEMPFPEGPFRIVSFGHVLNELWKREPDRTARRLALLERAAAQLSADGQIFVLEPATHAINREMLELRDALASAGWRMDAPCFRQAFCPALAAGVACHADVPSNDDREHATLARLARLPKDVVAYGWLLVRPPGPLAVDPRDVRIISERLRNKAGRERFVVCGVDGHLSLSAAPGHSDRTWKALRRGDAVRVIDPEIRESGWGVQAGTRLEPARHVLPTGHGGRSSGESGRS
jgi:SAM-dependent methyltransferase